MDTPILASKSDVEELTLGEPVTFLDTDDAGEIVIVVMVKILHDLYVIECDWDNGEGRAKQTFALPLSSGKFVTHNLPVTA